MSADKIVPISQYREQFENDAESCTASEIYPGFSERLNYLMDQAEGIEIPDKDGRGRPTFLHKVTGSSRPATSDWVLHNKPPRDKTLRSLVVFFLHHISGDHNPVRVESWLRYGDQATPNPFAKGQQESDDTPLRLLAAKLVAEAGKALAVTVAGYDFKAVQDATIKMLKDYGVTNDADIQDGMIDLVKYYIKDNPR